MLPSLHGANETKERSNSVELVFFYTSPHAGFPVHSCTAQAQWHEFLILSRDRKVIGHSSSTVPLMKQPWCAFHIDKRNTHTFISLISDSHTKDTDNNDRVKGCSTSLSCKTLPHGCCDIKMLHLDVGGQSGSTHGTPRSTRHEPNLVLPERGTHFMSIADGDDED